jgi:hypothetical protein
VDIWDEQSVAEELELSDPTIAAHEFLGLDTAALALESARQLIAGRRQLLELRQEQAKAEPYAPVIPMRTVYIVSKSVVSA